jgi:hypothetical protein
VETDVSLLYGGQQKNFGIRGMKKLKQMEENDVKENTLMIVMIMRWSKSKNSKREKRGM